MVRESFAFTTKIGNAHVNATCTFYAPMAYETGRIRTIMAWNAQFKWITSYLLGLGVPIMIITYGHSQKPKPS